MLRRRLVLVVERRAQVREFGERERRLRHGPGVPGRRRVREEHHLRAARLELRGRAAWVVGGWV
jgi:hypothetical protein